MLSHKNEFSRFAETYIDSNYIQKQVAKHLISMCKGTPKTILDLGCGGGEIYKNIHWDIDSFVGIDSSKEMCKLHPKDKKVCIFEGDFDDNNLFLDLKKDNLFDLVISSSSLQWSKNLKQLINNISMLSDNILLSIFTSSSFSIIHNELSIKSPLYSETTIIDSIKSYLSITKKQINTYKLTFNSTKELMSYIKHTGISGGIKLTNISDIVKLIKDNKIRILNFEVIYIKAKKKGND
jgi:malonyl-CoA O-methyltransferase